MLLLLAKALLPLPLLRPRRRLGSDGSIEATIPLARSLEITLARQSQGGGGVGRELGGGESVYVWA